MLAGPFAHPGQHLLSPLDIPDEVVVAEVDLSTVAKVVEHLELSQHLGLRLCARLAAEDLNLRAELAIEGAAADVVDPDHEILVQPREVVARRCCALEIHRPGGSIDAGSNAFANVLQKLRQDVLGLADDNEVHLADEHLGLDGRPRTTEDGELSLVVCAAYHSHDGLVLRAEARDHHDVRPREVGVGHGLDVLVDESDIPLPRQERRNDQRAEGRRGGAYAEHPVDG